MGFWGTLGKIADGMTGGVISQMTGMWQDKNELKKYYREQLDNGELHIGDIIEMYENSSGTDSLALKAILREEGYIDDDGNLCR